MKIASVFGTLFVLAVTLAASTGSAHAAEGRWTRQGPHGAEVRQIAVVPPIPARDPADHQLRYVATPHGVFKSHSGGARWEEASAGLADRDVHDVAIDPERPEVLFAATAGGVFRSTDGAATWRPSGGGLPRRTVRRLAIDPADPDVLYAGPEGETGVFKSVDGGASWTPASEGLLRFGEVSLLAIHPVATETLWVVRSGQLFHSDDGAATWRQVEALAGYNVTALAIAPSNPDFLDVGTRHRGIFSSLDRGATWELNTADLFDITALSTDPQRSGITFAGTGDGRLFVVRGATGSVSLLNGYAFRSAPIRTLVHGHVLGTNLLYAGTTAGFFTGYQRGARWTASNHGLVGLPIGRVVVDPRDSDVLYAASSGGGVFKSTDRGGSWASASRGIADAFVDDLVIDPSDPDVLFAAARRLYRSADGAERWKHRKIRTFLRFVNRLLIEPQSGILFVGAGGNAVYRSFDGGETFEDLYDHHFRYKAVRAMALGADGRLWVAADRGVLESRDQGLSWRWSPRRIGQTVILDLDADPAVPGTLYAVLRRAGLRKSVDGGANWFVPGRPLSGDGLRALTLDPTRPETLYAATGKSGVLVSRDGGATWSTLGDPLPGALTVTVDPLDPSRLYAGTDRGVFEIDLVE